ncbi:mechanosensitive ion channel [Zunongwangia sp. F363]|uniref:Mechanosensitive ion channel n=1 Tax=Autumnicola tepida TaxID=3075595 RepID=A0ABU3CAA1_9FLAO|nr:mechanosensitive ion channel domain-containing protein [Zunongwangia sp. F363]MDT0643260.1 mechanosensitive ion channel [Zunongwangia sp. F363]
MDNMDQEWVRYGIIGIVVLVALFGITFYILKKIGKDPRNVLPVNLAHRIKIPLLIFLISLLGKVAIVSRIFHFDYTYKVVGHATTIGFILSIAWFLIIGLRIFKTHMLRKYDVSSEDNLKARKVYTQFMILENIVIFIIVILALGIALMSFESIRSVGVSLLTSAGIAGIIIGLAAQKAIGTLLAGIQIAITQPMRLEDVVIVEGEWGRIEEITLTYVVVKIWDKRRLVVPSTYFIENTFQNWTRQSADILGTVFIYTDYNVPFEELRAEQTRILESTPLWDQQVNVVQVTDATEKSVQIRLLVSAKDSPTAWDLRVLLREKILVFLQKNYPESLPRTRIEIPGPIQEKPALEDS